MALTVIDKNPEKKLVIRRVLTAEEKSLLADRYVLDNLMSKQKHNELKTLCRFIRERQCWILCDCLEETEQPVLLVGCSDKGNYFIRNITSRASHDKECLFRKVLREGDTSKGIRKPYIKKDSPFNLVGKKSRGLSGTRVQDTNHAGSHVASRKLIATLLYQLLETSGLNIISTDIFRKEDAALKRAADSILLVRGVFLTSYLQTGFEKMKQRAFLLKEDSSWPENAEKHCLTLVHIKSLTENTLEVIRKDGTTEKLSVAHRIYQSSGRFGIRTFPCMALILTATTAERPNFYEPVKAFVMPTYSEKMFFPVDSFYEREVLRHLYKLYFSFKEKGKTLQIIKPLFDIPVVVNDNKPVLVLPDFIIKTPDKTVILEVNGSHEPEYLERKERMHQYMKTMGSFFSIDALEAESAERLPAAIAQTISKIERELA